MLLVMIFFFPPLQILADVSSTNGELDFEGTFRTYNATVTVTTSSAQALSASTPIFISLTNVQENPYFVAGPLAVAGLANPGVPGAGTFNFSVPEYSPAG